MSSSGFFSPFGVNVSVSVCWTVSVDVVGAMVETAARLREVDSQPMSSVFSSTNVVVSISDAFSIGYAKGLQGRQESPDMICCVPQQNTCIPYACMYVR